MRFDRFLYIVKSIIHNQKKWGRFDMDARPLRLHEILEGEKQYIVPVFQRFYSWKEKHWRDLWDDLMNMIEGDGVSGEHFMGTLVCMPYKHTPDAVPKYVLIDGQQRLSTLAILLCAIRDVARENGMEKKSNEIQDKYLVDKYKKEVDKYKVVSRSKDREFLFGLLDGHEPEGESRIIEAYVYFKNEISAYADDSSKLESAIQELSDAITKKLSLVSITLGEDENPWAIFETLNERGLGLEESDLIRNYVFMQMPLEEQDEFDRDEWSPFESIFEETEDYDRIRTTDFYRDYLMRDGVYVKKNETYIQFKAQAEAGRLIPKELVSELNRYGRLYTQILRPSYAEDERIEASLERFEWLDVGTAHPLILHLLEKLEANTLSLENLLACLSALESFVIRRSICRESTRAYGNFFPRVIRELDDDIHESMLKTLHEYGWPDDDSFTKDVQEFEIYRRERWKCRLILEELERSYKHKEPVDFSGDKIQIEHVMPQTLSEEWKHMLGGDWERVHEEILHTIGNLTLSGYNQELYNGPFHDKRDRLKKSNFQLNGYFADIDAWDEYAIASRGETLAEEIAAIWPIQENLSEESD